MKKLIKKILKESEFDWIKDVGSSGDNIIGQIVNDSEISVHPQHGERIQLYELDGEYNFIVSLDPNVGSVKFPYYLFDYFDSEKETKREVCKFFEDFYNEGGGYFISSPMPTFKPNKYDKRIK